MINKVVLVDFVGPFEPSKEWLGDIKSKFNEVVITTTDAKDKLKVLKGADAILPTIHTPVTKEMIDAAGESLKYIGSFATAFHLTDTLYATSQGIKVTNLGDYSSDSVAELIFGLFISDARSLPEAMEHSKKKKDYHFAKFLGTEINGKKLGVLGAGTIGSRVARIGIGFGMNVTYFSRTEKEELNQIGAKKVDLYEIFKESDFISVCLSTNKETEGIIGKDVIDSMKKGCVMMNIGPMTLFDMEEIYKKVKKKDIKLIIDRGDEMDKKDADKFCKLENCIMTPHIGFRTNEVDVRKWEVLTNNLVQFAGGNPINVVN